MKYSLKINPNHHDIDTEDNKKILIVYFVFVNIHNPNWMNIIRGQMMDLRLSGILHHSKLHIVMTCPENNINLINNIQKMMNDYTQASIDYTVQYQNNFEYEGIKKVYELSQDNPNKYILYFHSKGMVYNNQQTENSGRTLYEQSLTKYTVYPWEYVLQIFETRDDVSKIGLFPSTDNRTMIWMNFFWVRTNYIQTCENPILTNDRFYYETWLSRTSNKNIINNGTSDSYSIISHSNNLHDFVHVDNIGKYLNYFPATYDSSYLKINNNL